MTLSYIATASAQVCSSTKSRKRTFVSSEGILVQSGRDEEEGGGVEEGVMLGVLDPETEREPE